MNNNPPIPLRYQLNRRRSAPVSRLGALLILLMLAAADDSSPAAQPNVQVREWQILFCDAVANHANSATYIASTFPPIIETTRERASDQMDQPSPLAVIRFTGTSEAKFTVRLRVQYGGVFHAAWPPAHLNSERIVWPDLGLSSRARRSVRFDPEHWLAPLEDAGEVFVTCEDHAERLLLYDVELPFDMPLKIRLDGPDQTLRVQNVWEAPLHDLVLYRPPHDQLGWSSAHVEELQSKPLGGSPPAPEFSATDGTPARFLAADWKPRLAALDIDQADQDLIIKAILAHALDERQITAVFRLDQKEIDRVLPLQIVPEPKKIQRTAIVIVRNIDPHLPQIIDELIGQLGDPRWPAREEATRLLARYAPAGDAKLRAALRNSDAEIVRRAENLLSASSR